MSRIALFMHGGIASPGSTDEVPSIAGLVKRLAGEHAVSVYTAVKADGRDQAFSFGRAEVRFIRAHETSHPVAAAVQFLRAFARDHRKDPYALVHGFWGIPGGLAAVLAGRRHGLPSVVSLLGGEAASLPQIGYGNMRRRGAREATLWTCGRAGALTVLTRYQLGELRRHGFRRSEGIHVIPFGAERDSFPFRQRGPAAGPHHLLHVGHLNRVKDQATLLRAFQAISRQADSELRIVGEDTLHGALQRLAGELGVAERVSFTGFVPHGEMPRHFAWADLLLHTSLYEGEGVVFAEAAASGVAVCGTRVGLLSDLGEGLGASVAAGDHEGLARAAMQLLGEPDLMERMRQEARCWAEQHDADWSARQFAGVYEEMLTQ